MGNIDIPMLLLRFVLIMPAIILHEVAHGYVANLLGDPTAKARGRLTLNPIAHFDLWGTLIMPVLLLVVTQGRFAFGYAKPVPVNPYLMRKTTVQTGMLLTGIAGPVTNIALGVVTALVFRVAMLIPAIPDIVLTILYFFAYLNLMLAFFNLIPIPPLDGSRVVQRFLSGRALEFYESIEQYGFMIVIGLTWVIPGFLYTYFSWTVYPVMQFLTGVAS
ncbi:MAG: site-2 protease family protein [Coriobacteriia bacterium]|nr:site-2 protease family protein [Coriobacteriia bacterium]